MRFVDANIFLRYLTQGDPAKGAACRVLWEQVQRGLELVTTTEAIVAEVCYVLSSPRLYHLGHEEIAARIRPLIALPGLKLRDKRTLLRALSLYGTHSFLDFEDALTIAHMERQGVPEILSYDRDFDRVPGVARVEP